MGWVSSLWCSWISRRPAEVDRTRAASTASPWGFILDRLGLCIPRAPCLWLESPRACVAQAGESLLQADMTRGRNYLSFWLGFGSAQLEED